MPGFLTNPETPEPADWYSAEELDVVRLSSKSHWDVPIDVDGRVLHLLAAHPTPAGVRRSRDQPGRHLRPPRRVGRAAL
jgi:hypothetical protein